MDCSVDSQSEAAVSVRSTRKRQPIKAEQLDPHWLLNMRQTNQLSQSYEPIANKTIIGSMSIANKKAMCVFVPNCLYHVIKSHTRLLGPEDI